ncbi:MAG: pirin family protein [Pseudomonadota bacterium]
MTIVIRRAAERGLMSLDWVETRYSFSYGDYYNPRHMGFGALRALNEHRVAPDAAFAAAWRTDIETITYVCAGSLRHRDNLGNDIVLGPGSVQRISAGSGMECAFSNAESAPLHFIQIWVLPETTGGAPGYASATFPMSGGLRLLASHDGRQGSVSVQRDVALYRGMLRPGDRNAHPLGPEREAWVHVLSGELSLAGERLSAGDGIGLVELEIAQIENAGSGDAAFLLFDMSRD